MKTKLVCLLFSICLISACSTSKAIPDPLAEAGLPEDPVKYVEEQNSITIDKCEDRNMVRISFNLFVAQITDGKCSELVREIFDLPKFVECFSNALHHHFVDKEDCQN